MHRVETWQRLASSSFVWSRKGSMISDFDASLRRDEDDFVFMRL